MRSRLQRLPLGEFGFSMPLLDDGAGCYPLSCGITRLSGRQAYHWDNSGRICFGLVQYTLAGEGVFEDENGQVHRLVSGRAFVVMSPEQTRYWRLPGQDWHFIYLLYGGQQALDQTGRLLREGGRLPEFAPSSPAAQALADLYEMGRGADAYAASATLYKLLLTLRGELHARRSDAGDMPQAIVTALRLAREKFADAAFGAAELAEACGYSRYHFARLFRRYCGDSPQNYLISLRLGRAMERLASGAESGAVKQIAQDCGFRDYSYFCLMFRKRYGVSPGTLRRIT